MEWKNRLRGLMTGALITLGIVTPAVMYMSEAAEAAPTLYFEGVELRIQADGSTQAVFSVNIKNLDSVYATSFYMDYNPEYLTPSDFGTNQAVQGDQQGLHAEDAFFRPDGDLYGVDSSGEPLNPFFLEVGDKNKIPFSQWDDTDHLVAMNLFLSRTLPVQGKLSTVEVGENAEEYCVFHSGELGTPKNTPVTLGYLSFRVAPEHLSEVAKRFHGLQNVEDPTVGEDYLIQLEKQMTGENEPWQISYIQGGKLPSDRMTKYFNASHPQNAGVRYTIDFPSALFDLTPTEPSLTLDAYQLYHKGGVDDIANALRKYSPMLTATYTFGDRAHLVMPWGEGNSGAFLHDYKVYHFGTDTYDSYGVYTGGAEVTDADYDPTGSVSGDYLIQQYAYYESGVNDSGEPVYSRYPLPMTVKLHVSPITLTGLFADNLHKTYAMDNELLNTVKLIRDLKLPDQVRLQTDVPADGASLTMDIPGWTAVHTDSNWDAGLGGLHADGSSGEHWPVSSGDLTQGAGTYSFVTANVDGGPATDFAAADIRAAFRWLTVPDGTYELETATRTLVAGGGLTVSKAETYTVSYESTTTDTVTGSPRLQLLVVRDGGNTSMQGTSLFRVLLPDGTKLGAGSAATGDPTWPNWLTGSNYTTEQKTDCGDGYDKIGYYVNATPGDLETDQTTRADRERLLRYLNLGGWFYVSVNENTATHTWSDYIPVYVPPRENQYEEDKTYNFVGDNAKLFQYPGALGTTVTVPRGIYTLVNNAGETLYKDSAGADTTAASAADGTLNTKQTARFGVSTTYDGTTGAQPGALYTFRVVDGEPWNPPAYEGANLKHGPAAFQNKAVYAAYGAVENAVPYRATLRVGGQTVAAQTESVSLTYAGTGNVLIDANGNITQATFDSQMEGYTDRQAYTFVITNTGTTTLYDLDIDTWSDDDGDGNNFRMLQPPAPFLAPGQSTTFTLTYQFNLSADTSGGSLKEYRDTLFLTSSSHPIVEDHLLNFDAVFAVAKDELYRVTVKYTPNDGAMGTAATIVGEYTDAGVQKMDYTPGSSTFTKDRHVYIAVDREDEYTVKKVTYTQANGTKVTLMPYAGVEIRDGTVVYDFEMPADDVTILVEFEEGILSKLRLSDLRVYSDSVEANLDPTSPARPAPERIFQKTFTDQEIADAEQKQLEDGNTRNLGEYLMQAGAALNPGFDSSEDQYLVVVPSTATFAQVEAILRRVVLPVDGSGNIKPDVQMRLFGSDGTLEDTIYGPAQGDTAGPTHHDSTVFDAPEKGQSKFVDIDIYGGDPVQHRHYYVEIHRETDVIQAQLNYGNSPIGMIWNDAAIADKEAATNAFIQNRYSFDGLDAAMVPAAVQNAAVNIKGVHYWPEAWVKAADARYELETEPDVKTGQYETKNDMDLNRYALFVYGSSQTLSNSVPVAPKFTEPGIAQVDGVDQIWDSSNRPVKAEDVTRYVEVQVLNTVATTQQARFDVPDADKAARTVRIPLDGTAVDHEITAGWTEIPVQERNDDGSLKFDDAGAPVYEQVDDGAGGTKNKTETVYIRPGVYRLVYLFKDYDGALPITQDRIDRLPGRPFIILPQAGDVNADGQVDRTADVASIKNRVTEPLGYEPYDALNRSYDANDYLDRWVFYYRACDVNNDRNINNIDANELRSRSTLIQYYLPTNYGYFPPAT